MRQLRRNGSGRLRYWWERQWGWRTRENGQRIWANLNTNKTKIAERGRTTRRNRREDRWGGRTTEQLYLMTMKNKHKIKIRKKPN